MFLPAVLMLAASFGVAPAAAPAAPSADTSVAADDSLRPRARHALSSPAAAGFHVSQVLRAGEPVRDALARGAFPGAALAVGRGERVVLEEGYGRAGADPGDPEVDPERTVYDLASLTKVVGTTTAVMLLLEDGRIELDRPVAEYLPEFAGGGRERVTVRHLLTHTSGLPDWTEVRAETPEGALARVVGMPLAAEPGARARYSDLGFIVLYAAAERAAGEPLYRLLDRRVFGPLGMTSTFWTPGEGCPRCAPTARPRGDAFRGRVHDPIARRLGGLAGNAGLFSTVHDMARFAAMMANEGELEGVRVFRPETVRLFTRRQPGAGTRALGWDTPQGGDRGAAGARIAPTAYGHTGFTGTSLWIDPERRTWVVLLANRTYEEGPNRMQALRRALHDRVAEAADQAPTRYAAGR